MAWQAPATANVQMPAGRRMHTVKVQTPNLGSQPSQPDGDFVDDWSDLGPAWQVAIVPATAQSLERLTASTSIGVASHIVTGPYRSDVTLKTSLLYGSRRLSVVSLIDPNERHKELVLLCQEIVP